MLEELRGRHQDEEHDDDRDERHRDADVRLLVVLLARRRVHATAHRVRLVDLLDESDIEDE